MVLRRPLWRVHPPKVGKCCWGLPRACTVQGSPPIRQPLLLTINFITRRNAPSRSTGCKSRNGLARPVASAQRFPLRPYCCFCHSLVDDDRRWMHARNFPQIRWSGPLSCESAWKPWFLWAVASASSTWSALLVGGCQRIGYCDRWGRAQWASQISFGSNGLGAGGDPSPFVDSGASTDLEGTSPVHYGRLPP